MEIRQLEYFRAVVEEGTVSGAAKVLKMTQPPVSYQMKMLEEELNVQLFFRGTKKITLTEAGKVLYARSGSILKMLDVTKREVVKASQSATIHIGITPSTVLMMSEYIERFSKQYPGIHFDIHEGSTFNLKEQLEKHMIDITTLRTPITMNGCKISVRNAINTHRVRHTHGLWQNCHSNPFFCNCHRCSCILTFIIDIAGQSNSLKR